MASDINGRVLRLPRPYSFVIKTATTIPEGAGGI